MSNFDMFKLAQSFQNAPDAVDKGLEQFKNFLQVENGINRNFQDALTFKGSVDAINALNGWQAFNANLQREKAAAQREADVAAGLRMFDAETGRYRHPAEAAALAAREQGFGGNGYAWLANAQAAREEAGKLAAAVAPFDPKAAVDARAAGGWFGGYAPQAEVLPDGRVVMKNAGGQVRTFNPIEAAAFGIAPDKAAWQQFGWQRDDAVRDAEHRNALHRMGYQGEINLNNSLAIGKANTANTAQLNAFNHGLTMEQMKAKVALEKELYGVKSAAELNQYIQKLAWQAQYGNKEVGGIADSVMGSVYTKALELYGDEEKARNAMLSFGAALSPKTAVAAPAAGGVVADAVKQVTAAVKPQQGAAELPSFGAGSPLLGWRFSPEPYRTPGMAYGPAPLDSRAAELARTDGYIAQMRDKIAQNEKNAPNSHELRQQRNALANLLKWRREVEAMSDDGFYGQFHPAKMVLRWFTGNPDSGAVR